MRHRRIYSRDKLIRALHKNSAIAEEYLSDSARMERLLQDFEKKLPVVPREGISLSDNLLLDYLVRDYMSGRYTGIDSDAIRAIVAAIIYVVEPLDLVPDYIPVVGYLDDGKLLSIVRRMTQEELIGYRRWRRTIKSS